MKPRFQRVLAQWKPGFNASGGGQGSVRRGVPELREWGFGIGVAHWHAGGIAPRFSSAGRRTVRIVKGYLRFITEGVPDRRAGPG